jgi:hypothetical protein
VSRRVLPALVLVSVVVFAASVAAGIGTPLRPLVASWFLLACPGLALAPLIARDPAALWTLAISLSVAIEIILGLALLYTGLWSPTALAAVVAAISVGGATMQLVRIEVALR